MDVNTMTPNLISDQDRSDGNMSPIAERVLNMSYRNSPNTEKLKAYFEKKGQQEQKYNELMQKSYKQVASDKSSDPLAKQKSLRIPAYENTDITSMKTQNLNPSQMEEHLRNLGSTTPIINEAGVHGKDRNRVDTKLLSIESKPESTVGDEVVPFEENKSEIRLNDDEVSFAQQQHQQMQIDGQNEEIKITNSR